MPGGGRSENGGGETKQVEGGGDQNNENME